MEQKIKCVKTNKKFDFQFFYDDLYMIIQVIIYMSSPAFRHEYQRKTNNKGVNELIKENIMDGPKGLSFLLTKKVEINLIVLMSVK